MRGWKSATTAVEKIRNELESKLGERLFLIADARDRASEIAFYLQDKKVEGAGHPPVYIVEAQDIQNQFSFWPRYDEFVDTKLGEPRPDTEAATEGSAINRFVGRSAFFVHEGFGTRLPHNIVAGCAIPSPAATMKLFLSMTVQLIERASGSSGAQTCVCSASKKILVRAPRFTPDCRPPAGLSRFSSTGICKMTQLIFRGCLRKFRAGPISSAVIARSGRIQW
jgi:hypothetical protein